MASSFPDSFPGKLPGKDLEVLLSMSLLNRLGLKKERRVIYCLYFVGFMDLFAVSMILPLMARRARELGASPATVGAIGSIYGGLQLFSSPLMGRLSDVVGRRKVLLSSLLGVAVTYMLYGQAGSLVCLALCRIPAGIFKHSQSMAKTLLADLSPRLEHPVVFGNFNAISSMGFIVGPLIGGHLAMQDNGFTKVTRIAAIIFVVSFMFVLLFMEETPAVRSGSGREEIDTSNQTKDETVCEVDAGAIGKPISASDGNGTPANEEKDSSNKRGTSSLYGFLKIASANNILDLLLIRFIMAFAMLIFRSNFSSTLEFRYGTTPKMNGYIMSYNGILSASSGFLAGPLISRVYHNNDAKMLLHFAILMTVSILCITLSPSVSSLVVFIAPLSLASAVFRVCVTHLTFNRSKDDEKGVLQGIGNSTTSTARMISPFLGGLAQEVSIYGPGFLGVVLATIGVAIIVIFPQDRQAVSAKKSKNE